MSSIPLELLGAVLPALWLALVCSGLHWALARWFDKPSRGIWLATWLLLVALLGPTLFLGKTVGPLGLLADWVPWDGEPQIEQVAAERLENLGNPLQWDVLEELWPWLVVTRRAYLRGELPLWNPHAGLGAPLLGNPQTFALHPFLFLSLLVQEHQALPFVLALRLLVVLLFTYLFARRQRLGEGGALIVAVVFGLSGYVQHFLAWPHANAVASAMLALYALASWFDRGSRRDFLLLLCGFSLLLTSGHPETTLHASVLIALYAFVRLAHLAGLARRGATARHPLVGRLLGFAAAGILALLLALPALAPAAEYLPQTNRYAEMQERNRSLRSFSLGESIAAAPKIPLSQRLLPVVTSHAFGSNRHGRYWGLVNANEAAPGFVGAAASALALTALVTLLTTRGVAPRWRRRVSKASLSSRPEAVAQDRGSATAGTPLTGAPPAKAARGALRRDAFFASVAGFALLVAAGPPGLDYLLVRLPLFDASPMQHRRMLWLAALGLAFLAGSAAERIEHGSIRRRWLAIAASLATAVVVFLAYAMQWRAEVAAELAVHRTPWMTVQLGAALLVGLVVLAASATRMRRIASLGLLLVVATELLVFHRPLNPSVDARLFFPSSAALEWLQEYQEQRPGARVVGHHAALPPQIASIYGLDDPRSSGPSLPAALVPLFQPLLMEPGGNQVDARFEHAVFDLLAVHQVIGRRGIRPRSGVYRRGATQVWARGRSLDLLYLPRAVRSVNGEESADPGAILQQALAAEGISGSADRVLIDDANAGDGSWRTFDAGPDETLEMISQSSTRVAARTVTAGDRGLAGERLLASSIYQDGNWVVLADGEAAQGQNTNGVLVGAWLPAGTKSVEVIYRPRVVWWSFAATTVTLLVVAAAMLVWSRVAPAVSSPLP